MNLDIKDSKSFKFQARKTGKTIAAGNTNNVEIVVLLKYSCLSPLRRTIEISVIKVSGNI